MKHSRVTIINPDGLPKEYATEKALFFIGSSPGNDIIMGTKEEGIAPRHVQIIALGESGYRLVNLSPEEFSLQSGKTVAPHTSANVSIQSEFSIGPYKIQLNHEHVDETGIGYSMDRDGARGGEDDADTYRSARSKAIGLSISLDHLRLTVDGVIEGTVTVQNLGDEPGVQFLLELEGLEPGTYDLGPGPILFPGAQKATFLRIQHPKKPFPVAGDHRFTIRASAPDDYPRDTVVVGQTIHILPFYKHKLRLLVNED